MQFSVYQESHIGGRKVNQDRMGYSFTRDALLLLLADGMGGHLRGEMAAAIAMQTIGTLFQQNATPYIKKPERFHTTRMVPKRAEEILGGGSIFWVIRGEILCRERILDIRPFVDKAGVGRCKLVLDPKCVPVRPRPYRAFQGWRYLADNDAPPDLDQSNPHGAESRTRLRPRAPTQTTCTCRSLPEQQ